MENILKTFAETLINNTSEVISLYVEKQDSSQGVSTYKISAIIKEE